jgi:hypothetical protein
MTPQRRIVLHRGRQSAGILVAAATLTAGCYLALSVPAGNTTTGSDAELRIPENLPTHRDGRLPVEKLYAAYLGLADRGWHLDVIAQSQPTGTSVDLPIIALRSPRHGNAVWILSGIHGEEPAGPNAIARAIDDLATLAETVPVVLIPLCNPQGYARNWRYLNTPTYSESIEGHSVGDSSHLLSDPEDPSKPRAAKASSPEADALTRYLVKLAESYPPRYSIDLHEDDLIPAGYVYSQGELGAEDPLAATAVKVLSESGVPIKMDGQTRFAEEIVGGIIGPVVDSSIDELISAHEIFVDGMARRGPGAPTVLVFETPAEELVLERRIAAHLALLRRLATLIPTSDASATTDTPALRRR